MNVVSNSSPLINLAAIGRLELLTRLYETVYIPPVVYDEITVRPNQPGAPEVQALDWIISEPVDRSDLTAALQGELDEGEAQAITLALERDADLLLIDERKGRQSAARLGIPHVGLLGVLIEAKNRKHIDRVEPLLEALRKRAGFWISNALYRRILDAAGE